jgi:lipid A 3-O-deacylase
LTETSPRILLLGVIPDENQFFSLVDHQKRIPVRCGAAIACLLFTAFHVHAATLEENFVGGAPRDMIDRWEVQYDTAALWSIGGNASPLHYTFLPQMLSVKTPQFTHFRFDFGDFIVRARLSFLGEPIVQGPESYFVGMSFSPSLEWWNKPRSFAAFYSVGGGVGWMDSRGDKVPGGQGQDFNLVWFMHGGIKYRWNDHFSASLGLLFQHISNGGQTRINPGVDALGPTLGFSYHF